MTILDKILKLQPVFIDTAIFIYLLEDHPKFASLAQPVFDALSDKKLTAFSSIITVAEVLTKPMEKNNLELINRYHELFTQLPNITIASPNYQTAIKASEIRADYKFGLLDSFQLAHAIENKCKSFLTNDKQLGKYKKLKIILIS